MFLKDKTVLSQIQIISKNVHIIICPWSYYGYSTIGRLKNYEIF